MLVFKLTCIFISFVSTSIVIGTDEIVEDPELEFGFDDGAFGMDDLAFGENIFSSSEPDLDGYSNAFINGHEYNEFNKYEISEFNTTEFNTTEYDTDFQSFIINGQDTSKGEYPWFSTISIIQGGYISTICGGTLIHRNYVLTAAHCISRSRFGVEVGKYKAGIKATFRLVDHVCRHKFYNQATIENDIALLYFKNPITHIKPVRFTYPNSKMNIVGFGSTNINANGGYPTALQEAIVYEVDLKHCANQWGDFVDNRKVCASGFGIQDSCVGDSGGPLLARTSYGIKQVGLVSFGPVPCNDKRFPVIYTRTQTMKSWIDGVISGDKSFCTII